jgi:hypothetical protein
MDQLESSSPTTKQGIFQCCQFFTPCPKQCQDTFFAVLVEKEFLGSVRNEESCEKVVGSSMCILCFGFSEE